MLVCTNRINRTGSAGISRLISYFLSAAYIKEVKFQLPDSENVRLAYLFLENILQESCQQIWKKYWVKIYKH